MGAEGDYMSRVSATQRTLKHLRELGYRAEIVEKWVRFGAPKVPEGTNSPDRKSPGIRKDLFGFADIIALRPGLGIFAVQCFTTDWNGHVTKLFDTPEILEAAKDWNGSGGMILLVGWRKLKPRGTKVAKWTPRIGIVNTRGVERVVEIDHLLSVTPTEVAGVLLNEW